jgi:hypothetical protein
MIGKVWVSLRWSLQAPLLLYLILLVPSCELMSGASSPPSGSLSVSFIDVGQGDGVLVQAGGEDYLVDAGRVEEGPNVVDFLRSRDDPATMLPKRPSRKKVLQMSTSGTMGTVGTMICRQILVCRTSLQTRLTGTRSRPRSAYAKGSSNL